MFDELLAFVDYRDHDGRLAYWRLADGTEVDFVLGGADGLELAVEAKASARIAPRHLKGCAAWRRIIPACRRRVAACLEPRSRRTEDGIDILPSARFARWLWEGRLV